MHKEIEKIDRRITKTKKNILDAFIELINEKDVSKITIKELSERANINRKTFYVYYKSIDDLLEEISDNAIDNFLYFLDTHNFFEHKFDGLTFFNSINSTINHNFEFYKKLIHSNSYNFIFDRVKKILKDTIIEKYLKISNGDKDELNLYAEFIASGILSLYIEWFNSDSNITLENLAKIANNIVFCRLNHI